MLKFAIKAEKAVTVWQTWRIMTGNKSASASLGKQVSGCQKKKRQGASLWG
jgi:hypothetical protein